jgi:hypothetical protein
MPNVIVKDPFFLAGVVYQPGAIVDVPQAVGDALVGAGDAIWEIEPQRDLNPSVFGVANLPAGTPGAGAEFPFLEAGVAQKATAKHLVGAVGGMPTIYDSDGTPIGIAANPFETRGENGVTTKSILPLAPTPTPPVTTIDCGAFWYQDFGLEWIRQNSAGIGAPSWMGWYDWRWNHASAVGQNYYPDRHPALGWYRGDDLHTLSWQVKWMLEHGCTWAILQQRNDPTPNTATWSDPATINHWIYQLFTNIPAVTSGAFKLALWMPNSSGVPSLSPSNGTWSSAAAYTIGQTVINTAFDNRQYTALTNNTNRRPDLNPTDWQIRPMPANWNAMVSLLAAHPNSVKTIQRNGATYVVVFFWDGESMRASWGTNTLRVWLQDFGAALNAANPSWEGVAVLFNKSPSPSAADGVSGLGGTINYDLAEAGRAVFLRTDYNGIEASAGASGSYQSIIDNFPAFSSATRATAISRRVYSVTTGAMSVAPISGFNYPGHSPAKFQTMIEKIRTRIESGNGYPMLLIANVSEWTEQGPGLQPNMQDGFGYLTALKNAIT